MPSRPRRMYYHPPAWMLVSTLLCFFVAISQAAEQTNTCNNPQDASCQQCGLYLAESSIPGAGWGMFSGVHHDEGDLVTEGDIVIPLVDIEWNNGNDDFFFLWDEYEWSSNAFKYMYAETASGGKVTGASPGIGAAINCLLSANNVEDTYNELDGAGLHRAQDPGAGGFTPYHNRKSLAKTIIHPGQELFINYGTNYFASRRQTYGMIPFQKHYDVADKIVESFLSLLAKLFPQGPPTESFKNDFWELVSNNALRNYSRIIQALPTETSKLENVHNVGIVKALVNETIRDMDWLEKHGKCLDNIRPGRSTIRQAGRGAFATRFIPQGGLVTVAPLIHIPDRSVLNMYQPRNDDKEDDDEEYEYRNLTGPIKYQLLLNYCFGHSNSTMLLSPYGYLTSLINHSRDKPNTRIVWSEDEFLRHPEWRDLTPKKLLDEWHAGLAFDFIALRDIQEGEEIFLDYGAEWEDAWNEHVRNWKPPKGAESYKTASEMNEDIDSVLPTIYESVKIPGSVSLRVQNYYRLLAGRKGPSNPLRCFILDRYENRYGETLYMVETYTASNSGQTEQTIIRPKDILFGIPRDAFVFMDVALARDHSQAWSFRHEIMIPDDIFPEAWKNVVK